MFTLKKGLTMEDKKGIDYVMNNISSYSKKYTWCGGGICACLGCCNLEVLTAGYSQEDWKAWVSENPQDAIHNENGVITTTLPLDLLNI